MIVVDAEGVGGGVWGCGGATKVSPADTEAVAIAAGADDFQLVVTELDAGSHGQGAAMQRVHPIGVDVARQIRGATNAADDADLMWLEAELEHRRLERGEHGEIAAARAPIGMDAAPV